MLISLPPDATETQAPFLFMLHYAEHAASCSKMAAKALPGLSTFQSAGKMKEPIKRYIPCAVFQKPSSTIFHDKQEPTSVKLWAPL